MKILLIEDDLDLLDVTGYALQRLGHHILMATDGVEGLRRWEEEKPDVVVLDIGLPRMSGLDVCQQIRSVSHTPVLLLTANTDEETIIKGFRAGADDYVTKPFSTRVLAARINAIWSRGKVGAEAPREMTLGDYTIHVDSHELIKKDGSLVRLTPIEFRLLHILLTNTGRVVANVRLVEYAWGPSGGDISLLKTHISHIRRKLGMGNGFDIGALPSVGYRLVV